MLNEDNSINYLEIDYLNNTGFAEQTMSDLWYLMLLGLYIKSIFKYYRILITVYPEYTDVHSTHCSMQC